MAKLYHVDGTVEDIVPSNGRKFTIEEWQKYIGGYCAYANLSGHRVALYDEEGNLKGLKPNDKGSEVVGYSLVGPILVIGKEDGGL